MVNLVIKKSKLNFIVNCKPSLPIWKRQCELAVIKTEVLDYDSFELSFKNMYTPQFKYYSQVFILGHGFTWKYCDYKPLCTLDCSFNSLAFDFLLGLVEFQIV